MSEPIDWLKLSQNYREREQRSLTASVAIEQIIGEDVVRQAVDYYVGWKPESELARSVLWQLRPWSAMQRCYEIYRSDAAVEDRRTAIELLRVVADERVLDWITEFLTDPDAGIQNWSMGILDQMLFGGDIRNSETAMEKVEQLLAAAEQHTSPAVRQVAASLRADEATRQAREEAWDEFYRIYRNRQNAP